ncbi:MAG: hypothetical protein CMF48_05155 [Legionellales bacterium]|nr:hypothetical protein [Legionellales bacterium]|tara:strand:- start:518 stop:856 length:339 start_codon:yes stop_codon:yes gene_type:complete
MMPLVISRKLSILLWDQLQEFPKQTRIGVVDLNTDSIQSVKTLDSTNQWQQTSEGIVFQTFWLEPGIPSSEIKAKTVLGVFMEEPGVLQMLAYTRSSCDLHWQRLDIKLSDT